MEEGASALVVWAELLRLGHRSWVGWVIKFRAIWSLGSALRLQSDSASLLQVLTPGPSHEEFTVMFNLT